jgi:glutamine---fructose-6-phosphate transaminase (isomerizing)
MKTYMEREIFQQPNSLREAYNFNKLMYKKIVEEVKKKDIKSIIFAARGSSDNSGVYFKYLCESIYKIPVSFAAPSIITLYKSKIDYSSSIVIGVSQSGQAEDVLNVIEEANSQGAITITITNYESSALAKSGQFHLFLNTGEEKSVAATKTFMTQMYLLGLLVGHISEDESLIKDLQTVPDALEMSTDTVNVVKHYAEKFSDVESAFVLGRGFLYSIVKELALKLQETTYIHALSYSIADFYHGPFAMISEKSFCIVLLSEDESYNDGLNMLKALKKAEAKRLVITTDATVAEENLIVIPKISKYTAPFVNIFIGQYFCLKLALARGLNPDQPRGLNKVTITK